MSKNGDSSKQGKAGRNGKGQFLPGVSGNPGGRPRVSLTTILGEVLAEMGPEECKALMRDVIQHARDGKPTHLTEIWNRTDGKVPDQVNANVKSNRLLWPWEVDEAAEANPDAGDDSPESSEIPSRLRRP